MSESDIQPATPEENDEMAQREVDEMLLERVLVQLSEHFDAVQIFACRAARTDGTSMFSRGTGNWYARRGMVEDWRVTQDATTAHNATKPDDE